MPSVQSSFHSGHSMSPTSSHATPDAQAHLQTSLNALNAKIVQAQSLALANNLSVDEVLARMGGLNEMELGLLRLCAAREQEARLQANLINQQQQLQQLAQLQQQQQQLSQQTRSMAHPFSFGSVQEHRNAARMMVEHNLRVRNGRTTTSPGWQEDFGNLSMHERATTVPEKTLVQQGSGMMTPPTAKGERRTGRISPLAGEGNQPVSLQAQQQAAGKHEQAVSWRAGGKVQQAPPSPAVTPLAQKVGSGNASDKAVKGFNGVFGNRIVTPPAHRSEGTDVKQTRTTRSGSDSSSSDASSLSQQQHADRSREATFASSTCSADSAQTGHTTPPLESPSDAKSEYFGAKLGQGREESLSLMNKMPVKNSAPGVIGQGFAPPGGFSMVVRQPSGPPGGADELGNKNFATRLRQKAVSDLGVLGRRRAVSPLIVF